MAEQMLDPTSAGGQIGALQMALAMKSMQGQDPSAAPRGPAGGLQSLRPQRQEEYDTAKGNLDDAFSAKSVEGDDAAMWGALAKGFAAPAQNFWQSLATAGSDKANVVAGIEAKGIADKQTAAKLEYDHASKLLQSADMLDKSQISGKGNQPQVKIVGDSMVEYDPLTKTSRVLYTVGAKERSAYTKMFDGLIAQGYQPKDAEEVATNLIHRSREVAPDTVGKSNSSPTILNPPTADGTPLPQATQTPQIQGATGQVSAPTAPLSGGGVGNPSLVGTQILQPSPAGIGKDESALSGTLNTEIGIKDPGPFTPPTDGDKEAERLTQVLLGLEKQKKSAEGSGAITVAKMIQNNIDRVRADLGKIAAPDSGGQSLGAISQPDRPWLADGSLAPASPNINNPDNVKVADAGKGFQWPKTTQQRLNEQSLAAATPVTPGQAYAAGVPEYTGQMSRFTDSKERQEYIKNTPQRFQTWFDKEVAPIQSDLKDATLATRRLIDLQNQPDPNRPGAVLGTGHSQLDNLPIVGGMWQDFRSGRDPRLQEMQGITIDAAMAKRIKGTGVMTDADMRQYMQAAVGINKDPIANENIGLATKALADRWSEFMRYSAKFVNSHNDFDPATVKSTFQQYADANPLFGGYDKNGRIVVNSIPPFEDYFRANKNKFYPGMK